MILKHESLMKDLETQSMLTRDLLEPLILAFDTLRKSIEIGILELQFAQLNTTFSFLLSPI
jgi:hypothetical protein